MYEKTIITMFDSQWGGGGWGGFRIQKYEYAILKELLNSNKTDSNKNV